MIVTLHLQFSVLRISYIINLIPIEWPAPGIQVSSRITGLHTKK
jgi:hypothetical protein